MHFCSFRQCWNITPIRAGSTRADLQHLIASGYFAGTEIKAIKAPSSPADLLARWPVHHRFRPDVTHARHASEGRNLLTRLRLGPVSDAPNLTAGGMVSSRRSPGSSLFAPWLHKNRVRWPSEAVVLVITTFGHVVQTSRNVKCTIAPHIPRGTAFDGLGGPSYKQILQRSGLHDRAAGAVL